MPSKTLHQPNLGAQISELVKIEQDLKRLPPLTELQSAKLEHEMAIDHLYYSSGIEGTRLTKAQIDKAIHGEGISPATR